MSPDQRKSMIDRDHKQLSLVRQCNLLDVSRASVYYRPAPSRAEDLELMTLMDRQYLQTPFYGSRKIADLTPTVLIHLGQQIEE